MLLLLLLRFVASSLLRKCVLYVAIWRNNPNNIGGQTIVHVSYPVEQDEQGLMAGKSGLLGKPRGVDVTYHGSITKARIGKICQ